MVCIIIYLYISIYSPSLFSEETAGRKTSAMISYINLISSELFARVHLKILKKKNSIESYQINEASIEDMGAAQCFLMRKSRIIWSIKSFHLDFGFSCTDWQSRKRRPTATSKSARTTGCEIVKLPYWIKKELGTPSIQYSGFFSWHHECDK